MKIDYQDRGVIAILTITSSVFEFRRHNRVVDTALFLTNVTAKHTGFFPHEDGNQRQNACRNAGL